MKNIVLVGFMGTGKTAVAKALAEKLNKTYVSIDYLIEEREGRKISDIFRDEGEAYFRSLEKEVVREVSQKTDQVVDTGGGVVLESENMDNLKRSGIVICLWADIKTICERTEGHGHRPLLNVEDPGKRIKDLLEYRRPFYTKADFHVDTTNVEPGTVIERILKITDEEDEEKTN